MRILIATDTYYPHVNGASYFTQNLASQLQERGHDILVIAPSLTVRSEPFCYRNVRIFGVSSLPAVVYKGFRIANPFFSRSALEKAIREFRPEIVHLQSHFSIDRAAFRIARKMGLPVVGTNHFMPENLVHYLPLPGGMKRIVIDLAWKRFVSFFNELDMITTPTQTAADLIRNRGLTKKVIPASCGISIRSYEKKSDPDVLRKRYSLPNSPILFYLGRLDKEKNVDFVIRSLVPVFKETELSFVIAGKGAELENLKKLSADLGLSDRVIFTGFVPDEDKPGLYALADIFVVAGEAELQCISAMEAMASGLPVIGLNAVALPELIHEGENGFLFNPGDSRKLAESVSKLLSDRQLRERMSESSHRIIAAHDIGTAMERFESVYAQALRKKHG